MPEPAIDNKKGSVQTFVSHLCGIDASDGRSVVRRPEPTYDLKQYDDVLKPGCRFHFDSDGDSFLGRSLPPDPKFGTLSLQTSEVDGCRAKILIFLDSVVHTTSAENMIWGGVRALRCLMQDEMALSDLTFIYQTSTFIFPAAAQVDENGQIFIPSLRWMVDTVPSLDFISMNTRFGQDFDSSAKVVICM